MVLVPKREKKQKTNKNIGIIYIYMIKPDEMKNNKRTAGTRVNFME